MQNNTQHFNIVLTKKVDIQIYKRCDFNVCIGNRPMI
ncbi:hypothetical protein MUA68_08805 [Staphylococcus aureus]|nr:hypothetical protein [Staphylococcus aureus]UXV46824.1 hypothetical protein MUA24_09825 [Staphylococcus aureus]UXV54771.1 hypothetical protein MUA68_08805 [Staphylococcus aureus]